VYSTIYIDWFCDPPNSLIDDLWKWSKERSLFPQLLNELDYWVYHNKDQTMLFKMARKAVEIVDCLLLKKLPHLVVDVFLKFMGKRKA